MILRCDDPTHPARKFKSPAFQCCERWYEFDNFLVDLGPRPGLRLLERIDKKRGYEPGNCRWSLLEEEPWINARAPRTGEDLVRMLVESVEKEQQASALWFWL
jgi:hypothetical protein